MAMALRISSLTPQTIFLVLMALAGLQYASGSAGSAVRLGPSKQPPSLFGNGSPGSDDGAHAQGPLHPCGVACRGAMRARRALQQFGIPTGTFTAYGFGRGVGDGIYGPLLVGAGALAMGTQGHR